MPPVRVASHSQVPSILLHWQELGMSSKVNLYDQRLLLDNPEHKFLKPTFKKLRGQGEALPLLNLHHLDWATVFISATCNQQFERFGPPVLYQLRHGGASHEVFHRLSRRDGSAEKGPLGPRRRATSVREGCPHPAPRELRW